MGNGLLPHKAQSRVTVLLFIGGLMVYGLALLLAGLVDGDRPGLVSLLFPVVAQIALMVFAEALYGLIGQTGIADRISEGSVSGSYFVGGLVVFGAVAAHMLSSVPMTVPVVAFWVGLSPWMWYLYNIEIGFNPHGKWTE